MAKMFINGERVDAASGATMEVRNPATGELVDSVPKADADDTRRAIEAAAAAFPAWSKTPAHKRAQILMRATAHVRERLDEVAKLLTSEQGKPIRDSKIEAERFADNIEIYAGLIASGRAIGQARSAALSESDGPGRQTADRRRRRDHSLELPAHADGQQDRAGHGRRQYGRRQTRPAPPRWPPCAWPS